MAQLRDEGGNENGNVPIINYKWIYQNIGYILGIYAPITKYLLVLNAGNEGMIHNN